MTSTRLEIEYDGSQFAGWAKQQGLRTVQGELERALSTVARRQVLLTVGGRTDRGVHASAQVASHDGEPINVLGTNALLSGDVLVKAATAVEGGFNARYDATSRTYCFRLDVRKTAPFVIGRETQLWWRHRLDEELLQECARLLVGKHDFTAFTPAQTKHKYFLRTVYRTQWRRNGEILEFWIEANAFMRHMNRILMGTILDVAGGRRTIENFQALLEGAPRSAAAITLPPHGLQLAGINYPEHLGGNSRPEHHLAQAPWHQA